MSKPADSALEKHTFTDVYQNLDFRGFSLYILNSLGGNYVYEDGGSCQLSVCMLMSLKKQVHTSPAA
jgi:hypothetical protein